MQQEKRDHDLVARRSFHPRKVDGEPGYSAAAFRFRLPVEFRSGPFGGFPPWLAQVEANLVAGHVAEPNEATTEPSSVACSKRE